MLSPACASVAIARNCAAWPERSPPRRRRLRARRSALEDVGGRVHDPRVDVAELLQREQPGAVRRRRRRCRRWSGRSARRGRWCPAPAPGRRGPAASRSGRRPCPRPCRHLEGLGSLRRTGSTGRLASTAGTGEARNSRFVIALLHNDSLHHCAQGSALRRDCCTRSARRPGARAGARAQRRRRSVNEEAGRPAVFDLIGNTPLVEFKRTTPAPAGCSSSSRSRIRAVRSRTASAWR